MYPSSHTKDKVIEKELSYQLGKLFFEIQDELGRFSRERQYGDVFEKKLKEHSISYVREFPIEVGDRKSNYVDFFIESKILIDFKAKPYFEKNDYFQMKRYLHTSGKKLGLLVDFRDRYLRPKRILNSENLGGGAFVDSNRFVGLHRRRAFTLVEFMIVISIALLLTGGIAFYSRTAERQVVLYREQIKVVSFLQKARALSLSAFAAGGARVCGYGVALESSATPPRLVLFYNPPDDPDEPACVGNVQYDYNGSSMFVEELKLDPRVQFRMSGVNPTDFEEVIFIPADPTVVLNTDESVQRRLIVLESVVPSDAAERWVAVTKAGQITALSP